MPHDGGMTTTSVVPTRRLGATGPSVATLGLGLMGMSDLYGPADEAESTATIHAALDAGLTLLDTGDFYGMGHSEMLLRDALRGRARDSAVVSVKFGALRGPDGSWSGVDTRPAAVKNFLAYSLKRLGTDHVDVYRPARFDPSVPIEETVGAMKELVEAGKVRHLGLSEASPETIRRAHAVHPITALQTEYSLFTRDLEDEILPTIRELGIGLVPYSPLGRGILTGAITSESVLEEGDSRRSAYFPRLNGEGLRANLQLVDRVRAIADEKGCTPGQLALAWVLAQGDDELGVAPIPGTKRVKYLEENVGAADVTLTYDDLAALDAAVPRDAVVGDRYGDLSSIDS